MKNSAVDGTPSVKQIYTLVENGADFINSKAHNPEIAISGNGSDMSNQKALKGKAKRKMITQKMALSLIDISNDKKQYEQTKSYWNTYHCQNTLFSKNGRTYGLYCKNRHCTLCSANRKADIMNRYLPILKEWHDPYFVTLTVKSVTKKNLRKWIKEGLLRGFHQIVEKHRKRYQRGNGIKLMGIKSLECNFNPKTNTYNPHFHIIVPSKTMADILVNEWLLKWGTVHTNKKAQKSLRVTNKEKALIEVVKYGSKIFTEPDVRKKSKQKGNRDIYSAALNNIFIAMSGCRVFDRFGFNMDESKRATNVVQNTSQYEKWVYDFMASDWKNTLTDQPLTGYCSDHELTDLLDNHINKKLE